MVYLSTVKASFSYSFHAGSHILDCSTFIGLLSKFELYNVGCLSAPLVWGYLTNSPVAAQLRACCSLQRCVGQIMLFVTLPRYIDSWL
jgi:hypothetical protein